MRKTIFKWLILTLLIVYACGITIWAHTEARRNACKGIEITIETTGSVDSVTKRGVLDELANYPRKIVGLPPQSVDTRHIENYLSKNSNFEQVECSMSANGNLEIRILPMVPEARIFDGEKSYYINKEGKIIGSKPNFFVDVPVVTGNFSDRFSPAQVLPLVRFVKNDDVLGKLITMIHARDADNLILVPRINGHVINFGDTNRLTEKKRMLLAIYRKVIPHKGWNEYDTISVKFKGIVVASRRNKENPGHGSVSEDGPDMEEATLSGIERFVYD